VSRFSSAVAALLVAVILQVGFVPYCAIAQIMPNLLLIVTVTLAFVTGSNEGAFAGFIAGLAYDLIGSAAIGPMALTLTLTGFIAGLLQEQIFASGWVLPVTVLAVASLFAETLYLLILILLGEEVALGTALLTRVLPGTLYSTFVAIVVFPPLSRFLSRRAKLSTFRHIA
jgi:rod shape-determining protein MreD